MSPQHVALVGAGVIGNGWAAHLLAQGVRVTVTDPATGAEKRLRDYVTAAAPTVARMGSGMDGWEDRLAFADDIAMAVAGVDFVQESGPERADLKAPLLAALDAATEPSTIIASSSSGMLPSDLAGMCPSHPERVVVGHPFNPVYLIPLVEVVGCEQTSLDVIDRALAFYTGVGKRPIHVRQELPGHIANRLQAALWREAYSLVERGVASVTDIDTAIAQGPGLRWALLGPLANQHLSGGAGGLAHVLEHLGPPAQKWMDDLGAPQLTPALAAALVSGVDEELADVDQGELVAQRDELLIELLIAKSHAHSLP